MFFCVVQIVNFFWIPHSKINRGTYAGFRHTQADD